MDYPNSYEPANRLGPQLLRNLRYTMGADKRNADGETDKSRSIGQVDGHSLDSMTCSAQDFLEPFTCSKPRDP
jgi:hypothetical protein